MIAAELADIQEKRRILNLIAALQRCALKRLAHCPVELRARHEAAFYLGR